MLSNYFKIFKYIFLIEKLLKKALMPRQEPAGGGGGEDRGLCGNRAGDS